MTRQVDRRRTDQAAIPVQMEAEGYGDAAGFWRRLFGFAIDWMLCFAIPSLASSLILLATGVTDGGEIIDVIWMASLAAIILGYFTYFTMRGRSPGMRAAGIKVVDPRTGNAPALARSLVRGVLMLLLIGSWFALVLLGTAGRSTGLSNGQSMLLTVGYVIFLASFFGHFWIAWDRKRQTVQDKIAGIIVVRKAVQVEPVERPARRIDPLEWRM